METSFVPTGHMTAVIRGLVGVSEVGQMVKWNLADSADRQHDEHNVDHQHRTKHNLQSQYTQFVNSSCIISDSVPLLYS